MNFKSHRRIRLRFRRKKKKHTHTAGEKNHRHRSTTTFFATFVHYNIFERDRCTCFRGYEKKNSYARFSSATAFLAKTDFYTRSRAKHYISCFVVNLIGNKRWGVFVLRNHEVIVGKVKCRLKYITRSSNFFSTFSYDVLSS